MSTPIFKEALIESKKLKELAMQEAQQALLEQMSPLIKKVLDQEIAGTSTAEVVLLEQVEDDTQNLDPTLQQTPPQQPPAPAAPGAPAASMPAPVDPGQTAAPVSSENPPGGVTPTPPPTTEVPIPSPEASPPNAGATIDPVSGFVTVNFSDLFASGAESLPTSMDGTQAPLPVAEPTLPVDAETEAAPSASEPGEEGLAPLEPEEMLKESVAVVEQELLEHVRSGTILKALVQKRMETKLFEAYEAFQTIKSELKKEDAVLFESYLNSLYRRLMDSSKNNNSYTQRNKDMATKGLKEFYTALFEEIEAKGADAHSTDEGGEKPAQKVINSNESDKPSNHAMKASKSLPQTKSTSVADPGRAELKGKPAKDKWPLAEGTDEEAALEEELKEMLELEECGMETEDSSAAMGADDKHVTIDVNVNVASPEGGMAADMDAAPAMAAAEVEDDMIDMGDDDTLELVDDTDEGEEEESELSDDETESDMVAESVLRRENKNLLKKLEENQLLTARSLFVNKLFARENLSIGQKRKIVEYLDASRTINEAKQTYQRIKKVLDEADAKRTVMESKNKSTTVGSSSRATGNSGPSKINESAANSQQWWHSTPSEWTFDRARWAQLAGINKKST